MSYVRSLFFNFLIIFFVNRVVPGIQITYFEQVPNIGADILFAAIVGFLNASVFPFYQILELEISAFKLGLFNFIISLGAFSAISVFPFGVQVMNMLGFFLGSSIVFIVAFFTNYLEWQYEIKQDRR